MRRLGVLAAALALFGATLATVAEPAVAQTAPTANSDGSYSVPADWPLLPSGAGEGDRFRFLFASSTTRDAVSSDISVYDAHVQAAAAAGHMAIRPYSSTFRALGCTSMVDARDHTSTTGTGVPIHWLGGPRLVDDYADFYDGSWSANTGSGDPFAETGTRNTGYYDLWTGCTSNGTKHSTQHLGASGGAVVVGDPTNNAETLSSYTDDPTEAGFYGLYGLSPVFVVGDVDDGGSADLAPAAQGPRLLRDDITEGQTRDFLIDRVPRGFSAYWLRVLPLTGFTAEADDFELRALNRRVAPGGSVRMSVSYPNSRAKLGSVTFEATAAADSASDAGETFGVQLCTTSACTGGTTLGLWTVTIREPAADTELSGTAASVTVHGGTALEMLEGSPNGDHRDRRDSVTVTLDAPPSSDILIVGYVTEKAKRIIESFGRAPSETSVPLLKQFPMIRVFANDVTHTDGNGKTTSVAANSAENLSQTITVSAEDNDEDVAGGVHEGSIRWAAFTVSDASERTRDTYVAYLTGGSVSRGDRTLLDSTRYNSIAVPDTPFRVTDDDPTAVYIKAAATADDTAAEGDPSDTASFRVQTARKLIAGEDLVVPVRFINAAIGDAFTVALDGSPDGVSYADAGDSGEYGEVTFTGGATTATEATLVVTAIDDSDAVSERLVARLAGLSGLPGPHWMRTNLAGGSCARGQCNTVTDDDDNYQYRMLLADDDGVILSGALLDDVGADGALAVGEYTASHMYQVRLAKAPDAGETVTVAVTADRIVSIHQRSRSLSFNAGNFSTPQAVTFIVNGNSTDEPDRLATISHAVTSSGGTSPVYSSVAGPDLPVRIVDNDPTKVTLSGGGTSSAPSAVMVEGDSSRADALTVRLSRALVEGEFVRVPLKLQAQTRGYRVPQDSGREPRFSANVSWPPQFNDFDMTATGTGVALETVEWQTTADVGYREVVFSGAGAQTAEIRISAKEGFVDGEFDDDAFGVTVWASDDRDGPTPLPPLFSLDPYSNLSGGFEAQLRLNNPSATRWFRISDRQKRIRFGDRFSREQSLEVPQDWPLLPAGLSPGDSFRLVFATSDVIRAESGSPDTFDGFVRESARQAQQLAPYTASFRAVASYTRSNGRQKYPSILNNADASHRRALSAVTDGDARIRGRFVPPGSDYTVTNTALGTTNFPVFHDVSASVTGLSGAIFEVPNVPFYWVNGDRVADDNADFTDGSWASEASPRHPDGTTATVSTNGYWTGSTANGTVDGKTHTQLDGYRCDASGRDDWLSMGADMVRVGYLNSAAGTPLGPTVTADGSTATDAACVGADPSGKRPMFAISGVLTVEDGVVVEPAAAAEGSPAAFTVRLPADAAADVTIPYTLSDGRSVSTDAAHSVATGSADGASADYTDAGGSITIAAGSRTGTISVPTTDDDDYEGDQYFTVTLGTPTGASAPSLGDRSSATGTITDSADAPSFEFALTTLSVDEDAGAVTVTVNRTAAGTVHLPSEIGWTAVDTDPVEARFGEDYTPAAGTLAFAANETSKTFSFNVIDDASEESTERFRLTLAAVSSAVLGTDTTLTVTIADNDESDVFEASVADAAAAEGTAVDFTVSLSKAATVDVTVPYTLSDGRGMAGDPDYSVATGSDYTDTAGSITIAANSSTGTISVPTTQDAVYEGPHRFTVTLGTPTQASGTPPTLKTGASSAVGTITDGADLPTLEFSRSTFSANEHEGPLTLTVTKTGATLVPATVEWATSDLDPVQAAAGVDYTVASGTLSFAAGDASKSFDVAFIDDSLGEGSESFRLTLSGPVGAGLGSVTATFVTITDDDVGLTLSAAAGDVIEAGGTKEIVVTRRGNRVSDYTVPLSIRGATVGDDFTLAVTSPSSGVALVTSAPHSAQHPALRFAGHQRAATLTLTAVADAVRSQPVVSVAFGTGGRAPMRNGAAVTDLVGSPVSFVIADDETGDIVVAADSPLVPSGLSAGDEFRLLWVTGEARDAAATGIGDYDGFVRELVARNGLAALVPYAGFATALGSTGADDARDHTATAYTAGDKGDPVYWLSGSQAADDYEDFYDGAWDAQAHTDARTEAGTNTGITASTVIWTGSAADGTEHTASGTDHGLGRADAAYAQLASLNGTTRTPLQTATGANTGQGRLYALSPVFKVAGTPAVPTAQFGSATYSGGEASGDRSVAVAVSLSPAPMSATDVTFAVDSSSTAASGDDYTALVSPVSVGTDGSGTITVTVSDDMIDEDSETIVLNLVAGAGYTLGTTKVATVTVSDDDTAALVLAHSGSPAKTEVTEPSGTDSYTVKLATEPTHSVTVAIAAGAAAQISTDGTNFAASRSLTFTGGSTGNWNSAQTVTVRAVNDDVDNPGDARTSRLTHDVSSTDAKYNVLSDVAYDVTVVDDDDPPGPGAVFAPGSVSVTELGGTSSTATYTVALDTDPGAGVTVTLTAASSDTSAVAVDTDSSTAGDQSMLSFTGGGSGTWSTARTVTVRAVNDGDVVDEAGVRIGHGTTSSDTNHGYHNADVGGVPVSVTDAGHGVIVDPTAVSVAAGGTVTYGVWLKSDPGGTVEITPTSGSTANATVSDPLEFDSSDWRTAQDVTVTGVAATNSAFNVTHAVTTATTDYPAGTSIDSVSVTVMSGPGLVIAHSGSPPKTEVSEPSGTDAYTVALAAAPTHDVTVTITAGAAAQISTDGTSFAASRTLTFTPSGSGIWSTAQTVTVRAVNDNVDNAADARTSVLTHDISSTDTGYNALADVTFSVRVADDDATPTATLHLSRTSINESGAGNRATVTATLNRASHAATTLTVAATAVSPATSADFALSNTVTLTIAAGATASSGTVTITADDNSVDAANKTVTVSATASGTSGVANPASVTLTIVDDDLPKAEFGSATYSGGEASGSRTVSVPVTLTLAPAAATSVDFTVSSSSTASSGDDYTALGSSVSVGTGGSGTITVTVLDDMIDEDDETIILTLTDGTAYDLGTTSSTTITVSDDDTAGVTITETSGGTEVSEDGSDTDTYTVRLDTRPTHDVTVTVTAGAGAQVSTDGGTSFAASRTLTFTAAGSGIWSTAQTVTVRGTQDTVDNAGNERTATLTHDISSSDAKYNALADETVTVTVNDDDGTPTATLRLSRTSIDESGAANRATVTARLSHASHAATTLTVAATAVSPATSGDFALSGTVTLTIAAGATASTGAVTITAVDNIVDAANKTVTVSATASGGSGVASPASVSLTIRDDDEPRYASFASASYSGREQTGGHSVTVRVQVTPAPPAGQTVSVPFTLGGTASAGSDYTAPTSPVAVGDTGTADISIAILDDSLPEGPETITLTLTDTADYNLRSPSATTVNVVDDERTPCNMCVVIEAGPAITEGQDAVFTLYAYPAPARDLTVSVYVSDSPGERHSFAEASQKFGRQVVIPAGQQSATLTVQTVNDGYDEPDGIMHVRLERARYGTQPAGYSVNAGGTTAVVAVSDNDQPIPPYRVPTVTVRHFDVPGRDVAAFRFELDLGGQPWPIHHPQRLRVTWEITSDVRGAVSRVQALLTTRTTHVSYIARAQGGETLTATVIASREYYHDGRYDVPHYEPGTPSTATFTVPDHWTLE